LAGASSGAVGGMLPTFGVLFFLILSCSRIWKSFVSDQSTDAGLFNVKYEMQQLNLIRHTRPRFLSALNATTKVP